MDPEEESDIGNGYGGEDSDQEEASRPRQLPADLPRSLDDRQNFRSYNQDVEYYDAWQGAATDEMRLTK